MSVRRLAIIAAAVSLLAVACSDEGSTETTTPEEPGNQSTTTEPGAVGGLTAQDGDIVEVHYVGTLDDDSQFDSSRDRGTPFSFTVGSGDVISGFDEAVRGGQVGDVRTVRMEASEAYGEWSEANVIEAPFNPDQGDIAVGDEVFLNNGQPAIILEITEETVTLDANHPLAGEALTFEIEILAITRG